MRLTKTTAIRWIAARPARRRLGAPYCPPRGAQSASAPSPESADKKQQGGVPASPSPPKQGTGLTRVEPRRRTAASTRSLPIGLYKWCRARRFATVNVDDVRLNVASERSSDHHELGDRPGVDHRVDEARWSDRRGDRHRRQPEELKDCRSTAASSPTCDARPGPARLQQRPTKPGQQTVV